MHSQAGPSNTPTRRRFKKKQSTKPIHPTKVKKIHERGQLEELDKLAMEFVRTAHELGS